MFEWIMFLGGQTNGIGVTRRRTHLSALLATILSKMYLHVLHEMCFKTSFRVGPLFVYGVVCFTVETSLCCVHIFSFSFISDTFRSF